MEYASRNVANTGLGLGIAGTALGVLNGGLGNALGGILGGGQMQNMATGAALAAAAGGLVGKKDEYITRTEFDLAQKVAAKDSEIALLKSEQNTEIKIADVYERIMTRVNADQREQAAWNASQSVANAQMSAAIAANNASIAALQNCCQQITKVVVPNGAICPGWGGVTVTPNP